MKRTRQTPPCGRRRGPLGKVPSGVPSGLVRVLGVVAREEREWQGYTRDELAALARVDAGMIYRLECGRVADVGMDFVERLADTLGFRLHDFMKLAADREVAGGGGASDGPK